MALDALGYSNVLVLLPMLMDMNVGMAVGATHPFLNVNTVVMFSIFFLMAALASHLVDFCITTHMLGKIGYLDMTAGAGIFPVDRGGKSGNRDLVAVTAEARSRVNRHSLLGKQQVDARQEYQGECR